MKTQSDQVLLFAEDRATLRQTTRLLEALNYHVMQACDGEQAVAALELTAPGFVIVDVSIAPDTFRAFMQSVMSQPRLTYRFLMANNPGPETVADALEAGIDDFLRKPIVFGELLARMRAGREALDQQASERARALRDAHSGLLTERAVLRFAEQELAVPGRPRPVAVVAWKLDLFDQFWHRHGRDFAENLLAAVQEALVELTGGNLPLARSQRDQFYAVLTGSAADDVVSWAERLRSELAARRFRSGEIETRVTASFGVAKGTTNSTTAERLLQRALQAQRLAQSSGRNFVVSCEKIDEIDQWWNSLAEPETLFADTVARDVMIPCTEVLYASDPISVANDLFLQAAPSALPVLSPTGEFLGIVTSAALAEATGPRDRVEDLLMTDVVPVEADEPFAQLFANFLENRPPILVVVEQGQVAGYLTGDCLSSLMDPACCSDGLPIVGGAHAEARGVGQPKYDTVPMGSAG